MCLIMQLLKTLSLLLILVLQLTLAEVDLKRPNLSEFKLKSSKSREQLGRRKASESIVDLGSGAKYLHQSLFVKDKIVRCSSYAHLFKIIKQQQNSHSRGKSSNERIKQNFVESLAIDVAAEKDFYESLFNKELRTSVPENFIEATKSLETFGINNGEHIKGAWLDLLSCMSNYMENYGKIRDPAIIEFLWRNEERNEALLELKKKNESDDSNVPTTNGMVAYITKQISGDTKNGRSVFGRFMSNETLNESNKMVSSFDDEATQKARAEYLNKFKFNNLTESSGGRSDFLDDKLNGIKEPMPDYDYDNNNNNNNNNSESNRGSPLSLTSSFDESKMDVLDSVKAQLNNLHENGKSLNNSPRIDISSAVDFLAYFEDLDSARLDPTSDLGKRAILFQQSPQNRQLLARVKAVVGTYAKLVSVLAELKMQEDRWKSVDSDLRPQLDRLENLLESLDPAFNVEEIKQEISKWRAKCSEYSAIHQFIETDSD